MAVYGVLFPCSLLAASPQQQGAEARTESFVQPVSTRRRKLSGSFSESLQLYSRAWGIDISLGLGTVAGNHLICIKQLTPTMKRQNQVIIFICGSMVLAQCLIARWPAGGRFLQRTSSRVTLERSQASGLETVSK